MDEIAALRGEINALKLLIESMRTELDELKSREKSRDMEERASHLSIVADIERRQGIEPRSRKRFSGGYTSPYKQE